ncbi:MAG: hypothetical protein AB7U82_27915 [Blastocatellales bacterium]
MIKLFGEEGYHPSAERAPMRRAVEPLRLPTGTRGRQSVDEPGDIFKASIATFRPIMSAKQWRDYDLDSSTFDRMPLDKIVDLMADVSPEISRGIWDFLRMVNPGWKLRVYKLEEGAALAKQDNAGDQQREIDEDASEYLNGFIANLRDLYGSPNVVFNKIILGGFLRGGFFAELVLDAGAVEAVDLATPDASTLDWQQVEDPVRGRVWQFGQYQGHQFKPLSIYPTIKYVPIDALPGKPYGRAPIHPALFPTLFLIALLRDLKRVVAQQGYPRLDLSISLEKIMATLGDVEDPTKIADAVKQAISEVKSVYASLEPDDAYIHTDVVEVNRPVGAIDSSSLGAVDKLVLVLERMMVRALKTMPLMMAVAEGTSEANANRQWEIYDASIKSVQDLIQSLLEGLFSVALRAAGLQGIVEFRFDRLRASEALRDAQTEKLRIDNAKAKYNAGWITQDEASIEVTGHPAAEQEPRMMALAEDGEGGGVANPLNTQPEPGANRMMAEAVRNATALAALLTATMTEPTSRELRAASEYWDSIAPSGAQGLVDAELEE